MSVPSDKMSLSKMSVSVSEEMSDQSLASLLSASNETSRFATLYEELLAGLPETAEDVEVVDPPTSAPVPAAALSTRVLQAYDFLSKGGDSQNYKDYKAALEAFFQAKRLFEEEHRLTKGRNPQTILQLQHVISAILDALAAIPTLHKNLRVVITLCDEFLTYCQKNDNYQSYYSPVYFQKGLALFELKKYREAIAAFEQAFKYNPNFVLTQSYIGHSLLSLHKYEDAILVFQRAIELTSHPDAKPVYRDHFSPVTVDFLLNLSKQTIKHKAQWYFEIGRALRSLGQFQKAEDAIERGLLLDNQSAIGYCLQGHTLRSLGKHNASLAAFDRARQLYKTLPGIDCGRGSALVALGRHDEALTAFDSEIAVNPTLFSDPYWEKGNLLLSLNKNQEAVEVYVQALKLYGKRMVSTQYGHAVNVAHQRYLNALAACKAVIVAPDVVGLDKSLAYMVQGDVLQLLGKHSEAINAYETAMKLNSERAAVATCKKGKSLIVLKQYTAALVTCDSVIRLESTLASAHCWRAEALRLLNRPQESMAAFEQALTLDRNLPEAHCGKGNLFLANQQYEKAKAAFEQAILLRPNESAEAQCGLGDALRLHKFHEEALETYEMAVTFTSNEDLAQARLGQGLSLLSLGRTQEAVMLLGKTIQVWPEMAEALYKESQRLLACEDHQNALFVCDAIIILMPNLAVAYETKGHALRLLKRYPEALAAYNSALQLNINLPFSHCGRADCLVNIPPLSEGIATIQHYQEASAACDRAIQLMPDVFNTYLTKGDALRLLGDHPAAILAYDNALKSNANLVSAQQGKARSLLALMLQQSGGTLRISEGANPLAENLGATNIGSANSAATIPLTFSAGASLTSPLPEQQLPRASSNLPLQNFTLS